MKKATITQWDLPDGAHGRWARKSNPRTKDYGSVKKSRQRRSRHFPVLTYYAYAPRVKTAAAFPSRALRTGLDGPFGKTQGMLF
ncbi:MAG: hypothetical protein NPIRA03_21480 [Nitrospirales bacterium]|nr:MAG: hypothetical protein NPIRA03_21480 [Nitrospirales bacterium]